MIGLRYDASFSAHTRPERAANGACRLSMHLLLAAVVAGCGTAGMENQPRYEPLEQSEDGMSARPLVTGTVARGQLRLDDALYTGRSGGELVTELPIELNRSVLERGRERYNIFCVVCHDQTGQGNGMIPQRGFRKPPSFHIDRLRDAPVGHFYDVMTNGFGAMPSYAVQIEPRDRWAIVAYVRALQLSRNARIDDLPPEERAKLEEAAP